MKHLAGKRNLWYAISALLIIPCILSLALYGLNFGVDFTGGTVWEVQYESEEVTTDEIASTLSEEGRPEVTVQRIGPESDGRFQIRMAELAQGSEEKDQLTMALGRLGTLNHGAESLNTVGASVGTTVRNRSVLAIGAAAIGILLYIAWAFRKTQNPLLYGSTAIVTMAHDALIVTGLFSIFGWALGYEIDALFITALLTVIGFSVHDTIVIFDRIRENQAEDPEAPFETVVNHSIAQSLVRSLNTSVTTVFALLAIYLFGGATTQQFVLALLIGIVIGTYSSIFNAAQLLVSWENREIQSLFGRLTRRSPESTTTPAEG